MIYQIIYSVSYPNYTNLTENEIANSLIESIGKNFKKEDRIQTHGSCWFVHSELTAKEIESLLKPNQNINIIIAQISNYNIAGYTFKLFYEWLEEKNKSLEEMCEETNNIILSN